MKLLATAAAVIVCAVIPACTLANAVDLDEVWPTIGWSRATPGEMGMDASKLHQAREYALSGSGSGFIVRSGRLVMSWGDSTRRYDFKSATKSIGITALGLALKDGKMTLMDKARDHHSSFGIPPDSNAATGWVGEITMLQLATMTAGFDKPGGYTELLFAPGSKWAYSDSGPNWLADCLTVVYNRDLKALLFERVFGPLGIKSADLEWRANRYRSATINGIPRREFGSGISANVDAMARIGYLYLRGGRWKGQQLIPEIFINAVRTAVPSVVGLPVANDARSRFADASNHYGLLWWNNADGTLDDVPTDAYWAWGSTDSLIVVIPSLDLVIARAGSAWSGNRTSNQYAILERFLEPVATSIRRDPPVETADR